MSSPPQTRPAAGITPAAAGANAIPLRSVGAATTSTPASSRNNPGSGQHIATNIPIGNSLQSSQLPTNVPQRRPVPSGSLGASQSSAAIPSSGPTSSASTTAPRPPQQQPAVSHIRTTHISLWKRRKPLFRRPHGSQTLARPRPGQWISPWLQFRILALLFFVTVGIIGAIATLSIISKKRQGIAHVTGKTTTIASYQVGPGLAWTTLPVFLFSLYGIAFGTVVAACADRQPYVELFDRGDGASLEQSILLDYRAYNIIAKPWKAARRKHPLLVAAFIFAPIVTVLLSSVAAHLLYATAVTTTVPRTVTKTTAFNQTGFTARTDLVPIFDIVSSTRVYGGEAPDWTTFEYSIQDFSNPTVPGEAIGSANFSVETMAYSATLDCSVLDQSQFTLTPGLGAWNFEATDRGCQLSDPVFIGANLGSSNFTYYMQSFSNISCPFSADDSRLVLVAAANFNGSTTYLTNVTAISCETAYYTSSGILDVNLDFAQSLVPRIQAYTAQNRTLMIDPKPEFWKEFETLLHEVSLIDPTATTSATDFGRLILEYARQLEPHAFFHPDVLRDATETIFTAVYAVMSRTYLAEPAPAVNTTGTLSISTQRLLVVALVAYTMIGVLSCVALIIVAIFCYVKTHRSILREEPKALLGSAAILCSSDTNGEVDQIRGQVNDGRIREAVERGRYLQGTGWRIDQWDDPQRSRVVRTQSARLPTWKASFKRNF